MLHMLRSRSGWLACLLVALLWTPPWRRSAPRRRQPAAHRHRRGTPAARPTSMLPDLGQVTFQGINGRTLLIGGLVVCAARPGCSAWSSSCS